MVAATGVESRAVDGRDVLAVREAADELLEHVRAGRPAFIECAVFRVRPHSIADPDYRYRPKGAGDEWMRDNDPIARLHTALADDAADELDRIDAEVQERVDAALAAAEAAPQTSVDNALLHRYATQELQERA
jgi:TPP-dependent pyruvate/acetoin dehydrogenase alpha subunit